MPSSIPPKRPRRALRVLLVALVGLGAVYAAFALRPRPAAPHPWFAQRPGDRRVLPARQALELATSRGAAALGLEGKIGMLKVGKLADVITIATDGARQTTLFDPMSHLVYVTKGADVRTTVVNGRVLMREGRVLTLDRTKVITEANAMAEQVRAAVSKGAGR